MIRKPIKNGWYTWALATGEYGSLIMSDTVKRPDGLWAADHILTHAGKIGFYGNNAEYAPLYMQPRRDGKRFIGKCWDRPGYVEYDFTSSTWYYLPIGVNSNWPAIYDLAGTRVINRTPEVGDHGASGIRQFVEDGTPTGKLVSADDTYSPAPMIAPDLNEWSYIDYDGAAMVVGIGHDYGGVIVFDGAKHHVLAEGSCKAIVQYDLADRSAIAYYRERKDISLYTTEAEIVWATQDELRALPLVPPIEVPPVSIPIPAAVKPSITAFFSRFPPEVGEPTDAFLNRAYRNPPDGVLHRLCEYLHFKHGPDFGHKRRFGSSTDPFEGAPLSAGTFAMKMPGGMHCWDIMPSVGSGQLNVNVESDWVTDQVFFPVKPVDHLGGIVPSTRPTIDAPIIGLSMFDYFWHIFRSDFRWCERTHRKGLTPRVVWYASGLTGTRHARTFAEGMKQAEAGFKFIEREGLPPALMTMLCGTAVDGTSRSQALAMIKEEDALARVYPRAIRALVGGNELSHGIEDQSYMRSDSFWREAESLIDPRFPFARGAGHGGEGVGIAGGSFFTHHSDRDLDPFTAAKIMKAAQLLGKAWVLDEEGKRIEQNGSGQSTGDIQFVKDQIAAFREEELGGIILHIAAGRGANVEELDADPVQLQALALIIAEVQEVNPPVGDIFLDTDMRVDRLWYPIFVVQGEGLRAAMIKEHTRLNGSAPHDEMLRHYLWRACVERDRWRTMRRAIADIE